VLSLDLRRRLEFQSVEDREAPIARTTIGSDGTFKLGTFDDDDGALPGQHQVLIVPPAPPLEKNWEQQLMKRAAQGQSASRQSAMGPEMAHRYRSFATSDLLFTVTHDPQLHHFEIVLDSR